MNKIIIGMATIISLSSCISANDPNRRAKIGAGVGAAAGAVIGSRTNRHDALKGAAIGAALGTGIGVYMDKQAAELRRDLGKNGTTVSRNGDDIILNMPESITFDTGKSVIKPQFQPAMTDIANIFKKYSDTSIMIAGHTDSVGSNAMNQTLSENRAAAVKSSLSSKGVGYSRMSTVGYGETNPIASNASSGGRAQNRRVKITIVANK